jgi:hypothetical protein
MIARRGGDNPIILPDRGAIAELERAFLRDEICQPRRAKSPRAIRQRSCS